MTNPYTKTYNEAAVAAPISPPPPSPAEDENPFARYRSRLATAPAAPVIIPGTAVSAAPSAPARENRFSQFLSEDEQRAYHARQAAQPDALKLLPKGAVLLPEGDSQPATPAGARARDPMALLPPGAVLLDNEPAAAAPAPAAPGSNRFAKFLNDDQAAPEQAPSSKKSDAESWDEYFKGIARSVAQGVAFQWSDELESLARAAFNGDRDLARAKIRDEISRFQKRHPYVAAGSEIAGAIAIPGAAGARVGARLAGAGAGLLRKAAAGGAIGVAEGAASGAGSTEGPLVGTDIKQTAIGAGTGAVVGGVLGAALPGAGHVVGRMFEGSGTKASRLIRDAMQDDAILSGRVQQSPTEIVRAAADRDVRLAPTRGAPSEATVATLGGERVQGLAREASQQSVPAQAMARRYVDELRAARPGSLEFEKAYAAPPITSTTLDALITNRPALRQANALAKRNLADLGVTPPSGAYTPQHLHEMDRALRDASERLWRGGQSARASAVDAARQQLQGIIQKKMPALAAAQSRHAAAMDLIRRAPQATDISQRLGDPAASAAKNILGAGLSLSMGHKASAMNRIMHWAMGNSAMPPNIAEAVMRKLLTKARNAEDFEKLMSALDRMDSPKRSTYLASALIADQAGKTAGAMTGQQY